MQESVVPCIDSDAAACRNVCRNVCGNGYRNVCGNECENECRNPYRNVCRNPCGGKFLAMRDRYMKDAREAKALFNLRNEVALNRG